MPKIEESPHRAARLRMVEEQLVRQGVSDIRVLTAMRKIPRHLFVPEAVQEHAYSGCALPIGEGQTISQPYMVGLMSEALELTGTETVLEIGTGSGYQTVILAELAARVFSMERFGRFVAKGWETVEHLNYQNVVLRMADGTYGWKEEAPFDAILVAAGSPTIPIPLVEQLKVGGRMIIPVGEKDAQVLHKVVKCETGITVTPLIPCVFVPLLGAFGWNKTNTSGEITDTAGVIEPNSLFLQSTPQPAVAVRTGAIYAASRSSSCRKPVSQRL